MPDILYPDSSKSTELRTPTGSAINAVAHVKGNVEQLRLREYLEAGSIYMELRNHGRPENPDIELNPKTAASNVPQAWSRIEGDITYWYYNYAGALAEAVYTQSAIPTLFEWYEFISNIDDGNTDELLRKCCMVKTGYRIPYGNEGEEYDRVGKEVYYWASDSRRAAEFIDCCDVLGGGGSEGGESESFPGNYGHPLRFLHRKSPSIINQP